MGVEEKGKVKRRAGIFNLKDKKKISTKILTLLITSLCVVVCITSAIAISMSYRTTLNTINSFLTSTTQIAGRNIKSTIEAQLTTVSEFASRSYFTSRTRTTADTELYCKEFTQRHGFLQTSFATEDGISELSGNNISDRDYFLVCKATLEPAISDPVVSRTTGAITIVLAAPVLSEGKFKGIIITQTDASILSNLTNNVTIGETGKAYMLDKTGNTIAHYDDTLVLEGYNAIEEAKTGRAINEVAEIQSSMITGESGFATFNYNGTGKFLGYAPVGLNGWSIGIEGNTAEFLQELYLTVVLIVVLALLSIAAAVMIARRQVGRITEPIKLCTERFVLLGRGDLKTEFPVLDTQDEIGVMGGIAKEMVSNLDLIIGDVDYLLGEIAEGNLAAKSNNEDAYIGDYNGLIFSMHKLNDKLSNTLTSISDASKQVAMGSSQMAENAQGLAEGATEQAGATEELQATIVDILAQMEANANESQEAYRVTGDVTKVAGTSASEMNEMTEAMTKINETSRKIGTIIEEIEDIATQTNLLSLNAAIEAARAGEAGRGFSVVAEQIGKLAEGSSKSAANTKALIEASINEVGNGSKIAEKTAQSLQKVVNELGIVAQKVQTTSAATVKQSEAMKVIENGIEHISGIVQSNSAAAEEASATSEELSAQAANLRDLVGRFKIKK